MQRPILRVAVLGARPAPESFPALLARAGHHVTHVADAAQAAEADLILLDVEEDAFDAAVHAVAEVVHPGHIVAHLLPSRGVQELDAVEVAGAVVISLWQLSDEVWAGEALDELGDTILGLLVSDAHGRLIRLDSSRRRTLRAALDYVAAVEALRRDAVAMLSQVLGDDTLAAEVSRERGALIDDARAAAAIAAVRHSLS
ncbi:6PGD fold domain-containing protein [Corynebacterium uterequi]|uniref:Rossmann-like domain n=1 Tax=Corynebacterium uterequi TaxID=1072256 RepID=A0A0G3HET9_9CORY|nr:hypothetical protein [Corynebacterium uterequi]AKK11871.1 Rossmann-like domain [Corynebacterium uterequi]